VVARDRSCFAFLSVIPKPGSPASLLAGVGRESAVAFAVAFLAVIPAGNLLQLLLLLFFLSFPQPRSPASLLAGVGRESALPLLLLFLSVIPAAAVPGQLAGWGGEGNLLLPKSLRPASQKTAFTVRNKTL